MCLSSWLNWCQVGLNFNCQGANNERTEVDLIHNQSIVVEWRLNDNLVHCVNEGFVVTGSSFPKQEHMHANSTVPYLQCKP